MRTRSNLSDLLFGQIRSGILTFLYGRPDQSFYLREIARQLDASPGAVQRDISQLTEAGLIHRIPRGPQVFYQANSNSPIFTEMRDLLRKTSGVHHVLSLMLGSYKEKVRVAFVYGSVARQEETAGSDVDLMMVGSVTLEELMPALREARASIGREVNATVYTPREFRSKIENGNHFLRSVLKNQKLFLIGNQNELDEMGGIRMAQAADHKSR